MKKLLWLIPYMMILVLGFYNVASAAEVLVKNWDRYDAAEAGDIFSINEDGFPWGTQEDPRTTDFNPPFFYLILLPGVPVEDVRHLLVALFDEDPQSPTFNQTIRERKFYLKELNIPPNIMNQLKNSGGVLEATATQFNNFVANKAEEILN